MACGSDQITSKMLKFAGQLISQSLTKLFNFSLTLGEIPAEWKCSNIVPIPKSSETSIASNYRPISLLSHPSKLLERHVHSILSNELDNIGFFSNSQFGFRPGRGTGNAIASATSTWFRYLEDRSDVCVAFFDFAKAFDTIPHQALSNKISSLGIHPSLLNWLANYLSHRQQRVVLENSSSSYLPVRSGVPQGSILGPLLFTIYVNDILLVPFHDNTTPYMYADDLSLSRPLRSTQGMCLMHAELHRDGILLGRF